MNGYDEPLRVARSRVIDESGRRHRAVNFKRLEKGTFRFPAPSDAEATSVAVNATDLIMLLDGVDLRSVKRRPRYVRESA